MHGAHGTGAVCIPVGMLKLNEKLNLSLNYNLNSSCLVFSQLQIVPIFLCFYVYANLYKKRILK